MARFLIKNGHQKGYDKIGLCAQNISTILGSIGNIRPMQPLEEKENIHFDLFVM